MNKLPLVSIIIPALNAENTIKDCLNSIKQLDYPDLKIEVIVVDNGSDDKTADIAMQFGAKVLYKPDLNVGGLRNAGAKVSSGDILAFTDADCVVEKDWLSQISRSLSQVHSREDIVCVLGNHWLDQSYAFWSDL